MKSVTSSILFLCFFIISIACHKNNSSTISNKLIFDSIPIAKTLAPLIVEASGIADSKINQGYLWVQEDSGNPPELYLLGNDGKVLKKIYIKNTINRDWEDMALSGNEIFIADIGDNNKVFQDYAIYYFPEPSSAVDTVKNAVTISFQYPDGSHDAEAFIIDPAAKDIYIITKNDNPSKIFKIKYPYKTNLINTATLEETLSYSGVVSAAISQDGKEILIKTYFGINYYKLTAGENIATALKKTPKALPYTFEPQGEAICFNKNDSGFYTLSEKGMSNTVVLYFYPRK